jgi:hypothetical protein
VDRQGAIKVDEQVAQAKAYLGDKWLLAVPITKKGNRPEKPKGTVEYYLDDFHWEGTYWRLLVFCFPGGPGVLDIVDEVWSCRTERGEDRWGRLPMRAMPEGFYTAVQAAVDDEIKWGCVE